MAPEIKKNESKQKNDEKIQYNPFLTDGKKKKAESNLFSFYFQNNNNKIIFFHSLELWIDFD